VSDRHPTAYSRIDLRLERARPSTETHWHSFECYNHEGTGVVFAVRVDGSEPLDTTRCPLCNNVCDLRAWWPADEDGYGGGEDGGATGMHVEAIRAELEAIEERVAVLHAELARRPETQPATAATVHTSKEYPLLWLDGARGVACFGDGYWPENDVYVLPWRADTEDVVTERRFVAVRVPFWDEGARLEIVVAFAEEGMDIERLTQEAYAAAALGTMLEGLRA
jgi:hypothetical protein